MAILIIVSGVGNSGKTTSIKNFAKANLTNLPSQTGVEISHAGPLIKNPNQYMIGIRSAGDTKALISAAIRFFTRNKCDLMVCATKSRGVTVAAIDAYIAANPSLTVYRIQTQSFTNYAQQAADNARVENEIWGHIP